MLIKYYLFSIKTSRKTFSWRRTAIYGKRHFLSFFFAEFLHDTHTSFHGSEDSRWLPANISAWKYSGIPLFVVRPVWFDLQADGAPEKYYNSRCRLWVGEIVAYYCQYYNFQAFIPFVGVPMTASYALGSVLKKLWGKIVNCKIAKKFIPILGCKTCINKKIKQHLKIFSLFCNQILRKNKS